MGSERAEYVATLDTSQVQTSLTAMRVKQDEAVIGYGALNTAVQKLTTSTAEYSKAVFVAEKSWWSLEGAGKALQKQLGPQAAAISSISNALGEHNSKAGQAVQVAGQMAAAFAAGGPLGLALAAAGAGVVALQKHWDDLIAKQNKALDAQFSGTDLSARILKRAEADVAGLRDAARAPAVAAGRAVDAEIAAARAQIEPMQQLLLDMGKPVDDATKQLLKAIAVLEDKRELAVSAALKGPDAAAAKTDNSVDDMFHRLFAKQKAERDAAAEHEKLVEDAVRDEIKFTDLVLDKDAKAQEALTKITQAEAKKRADAEVKALKETEDAYNRVYGEGLNALLGGASSTFMGFLEAQKAGEKDAAQKGAAEFLKGTGTQLMGLGVKNLLEGGAMALAGNPAGAGIAGIGALELVAGAGMGGLGVAISPATAAAGATSRAATDGGVNRGGGRGASGGTGGGLTINVTYGAAGPAPQDTGRHVVEAIASYQRASGTALGQSNVQGPRR